MFPLTPLATPPRWATLALAVFAGAAMWAAFPDLGIWPLTVVSLVLAQLALSRDHAGWNFLVGYVMGAVFWLPHLYWVIDATEVAPWLALALVLCTPFFGAFGALWTWARRLLWRWPARWLSALVFALVWTGVEEWRSRVPFGGFPWGRLAWAVAGAAPGRAAWLGGSVLATFLLALAAGLIGSLLLVPGANLTLRASAGQTSMFSRVGVVAGALACVFSPLLLPLPRSDGLHSVPNPPATTWIDPGERRLVEDAGISSAEVGLLTVGFAQGSNSNPGGDAGYNAQEVLENHLRQTDLLAEDNLLRTANALGPPGTGASARLVADFPLDLVVWPEDSTGWNPVVEPAVATMLDQAVAEVHAPLLIGAQELPETGGRYNVMLLWGDETPDDDSAWSVEQRAARQSKPPSATAGGVDSAWSVEQRAARQSKPPSATAGGVISRYAKQRPVPFGEYMPLRSVLRRLSAQVDRVQIDMIAADNPPIIELPVPRLGRTVPLGVGICFEVAYDDIFRQAVRDGAEVIFVPTNNASFGRTAQSTQQLAMTQMQAIATGRAAAQISTVGVSGVFAPDGTLVARTGLFQPDRITAAMPLRTSITPAVRLGAAPGIIAQALALALPAAGLLTWRATTNRHAATRRSQEPLVILRPLSPSRHPAAAVTLPSSCGRCRRSAGSRRVLRSRFGALTCAQPQNDGKTGEAAVQLALPKHPRPALSIR